MPRILTTLLSLITVMGTLAAEVTTTSGQLSTLIDDTSITSLTLTGTIDARDFRFIASELTELTELDLSDVRIEAFLNRETRSTGLPESPADAIPAFAFMGTHLTQVTLPSTLTSIEEAAFAGTAVSHITLVEGLQHIGDYAFSACNELQAVELPASLLTIGNGAWAHCAALQSVTAASQAALRVVGQRAFLDCPQLAELHLGNAIESVGTKALAGTALTTLDWSACTRLIELGDYVLVGNNVLEQVTFPANLANMGRATMLYLPALNAVRLGSKVEEVPAYTFAGSNMLTQSDLIPNDTKQIGDYALYNLDHAVRIILPSSVTYIGTRAMAGTTALQKLTSRASEVPQLGEDVWEGIDQSVVLLSVPNGTAEDYMAAEQWKEFMLAPPAIKGDVNGDGVVSAADISCIVNVLAGLPPERSVYEGRDDVNNDGVVSAADLSEVVNILAGLSFAPMVTPPNTADAMRLDDLTIAPGQTRTIALHLDNTRPYTAMQCDIELPAGLTIEGSTPQPSKRATDHKWVMTTDGDNHVRLIAYSMRQNPFAGNGGEIVNITVRADKRLDTHTDNVIKVYNTVMATADCQSYYAAPTQALVNNTTGIDEVEAQAVSVFATTGTLHIVSDHATTALIVAMNGTSREVEVAADHNTWALDGGIYVVRIDDRSHKVVVK